MTKIIKIVFFTLVGLVLLTGCGRGVAVYNVQDNPVDLKAGVGEDKVYKAIKNAGIGLGWQIVKIKPGLAQGELNLRKHTAIVEIPYSTNSYSILYKNSTELGYDAEKNTIHKNYNSWVQNLNKAIKVQLNQLED